MAMTAVPELRDDLHLLAGPRDGNGEPSWTIHDPVRNRFLRIGRVGFALLSAWGRGTPQAVADGAAALLGRRPSETDVEALAAILSANSLLRQDGPGAVDRLCRIAAAARPSFAKWLLHNYLFVRIPLVRPDRFLAATARLVAPLYSRAAAALVIGLAMVGALLVLRQWEAFVHTFLHFFTWEGMAWYGVALAGAKVLHELGHAYTAHRYGCRVPTMGVALLVMWPVLYTDTTDAWRLSDRRRRLAIGAAGMAAELGLAAVATVLWSFLPDGPARSAAFLLATVTWVMTLAINLNPFMRFDGYYLLSDLLGVENLQERAFALARWRLREALFGFGEPRPERFRRRLTAILLAYAYGTWVYRLFLFLGIAVVVYLFFFKVLGLFLFAVEIAWFIARPLWTEAREWWTRRRSLRLNRNLLATLAGLAAAGWAVASPWQGHVAVPAVVRAADHAFLFAPVPARIEAVAVAAGQRVAVGDPLIQLAAPRLDHEIAQTRRRIAEHRLLVRREAASPDAREAIRVERRRLAAEITRLAGLEERRARLTVRAPLAGVVTDVAASLRPGRWIDERLALGLVVDDGRLEAVGYVDEADLSRLRPGAAGTFYPNDPVRAPLPVRLAAVDRVDAKTLDLPYLAGPFGGPIPARVTADGAVVPAGGVYRIVFEPAASAGVPRQVVPGIVRVDADRRSLLDRLWRHVAGVLVRESGF